MSIEIVNGRVFVEGKETVNPELIGFAVLDLAENNDVVICTEEEIKKLLLNTHDTSFKAGLELDDSLKSIGKA